MDAPPEPAPRKKETGMIIVAVVCAIIAAQYGPYLWPDAAVALGRRLFGIISGAVVGGIVAGLWLLSRRLFHTRP
jgi:hypothetical protein